MKNKVSAVSSRSSVKWTWIICTITAVLLLAFIILWFFIPSWKAGARLGDLRDTLENHQYTKIVIGQVNAYPSGSFEQITKDFEHILTEKEEAEFVSILLSSCKVSIPCGTAVQKGGFWDMKVSVLTEEERLIFYIDEQYVYLTDGNTRFNFECADSSLYEFVQAIKAQKS